MTLANRVALAVGGEDDADDGHLPADAARRLEAAAASGAGAVVSELVAVAPEGRVTPGTPGLWADDQAGPWAEAARAVAERGSTLVLRLGHAGRRGATRPRRAGVDRPLPAGGWPLLAASAIPYTPASQVPAAMTPADMEGVVREFAAAARRAAAAGVEVLLLDLAHGYLLGGFLSPLANRRDDGLGGRWRAGCASPSRWSTPSATPGPRTGPCGRP